MASSTLYPPILNYSEPAFIVAEGKNNVCKINFALSDFSTTSEEQSIKGIQVSIIRQSTGQNVVNKIDDQDNKRYRKTGIILLSSSDIKQNTDGTYYIEIYDSDIQSGDESGWVAGWIYKVQLRLSLIDNYNPINNPISQSLWLTQQGNNFSEWSTFCTVKATSKPDITITSLKAGVNNVITTSTLHFVGSYDNDDVSENLYSYSLNLLQGTNIIESSGLLYSNQYGSGKFDYTFKHELIDKTEYSIILSYSTINKYTETLSYSITTEQALENAKEIYVVCAETANYILPSKEDPFYEESIYTEQENGYIRLKLYSRENSFKGTVIIRRTDSKSNFTIWEDIKIITFKTSKSANDINSFHTIYDFTAESGIFYRYGIQTLDSNNNRTKLQVIKNNNNDINVIRDFEYSYLIGENNKILKLSLNNTMGNYNYTYIESKTDTIGGTYPIITRNGNTKYRTFPINGMISTVMDDNEFFTSDLELYKYMNVVSAYNEYRIKNGFSFNNDFQKEFKFREKVLEFLQDGKPKLFKSASEGNIIVQIMNVASQPNQTLNRMLYSFTSTANEVAEDSLENYKKYGFIEINEEVS